MGSVQRKRKVARPKRAVDLSIALQCDAALDARVAVIKTAS